MSYTGQEYLAHTQLYHYNARLYDPITCRMLQADKLVADPKNGQNYNRYSYVLNNPLKYTDPSGWAQQQARGSAPDFTEWHASGLGLVMIDGIYQDINDPFFGPTDQMGNSISSPRVELSNDI